MSRHLFGLDLAGSLPGWVLLLAVLLTQLGDVWFVLLLLGVLYWVAEALPGPLAIDRTSGAFAVALTIGGMAVTTALKAGFSAQRPPGAGEAVALEFLPHLLQALYTAGATASGYAFPSGHAVVATVVYGGLALLVGSRRATALAGLVVVVVALTRVVLGVHYLVDVVAGVAIGAVYVAVVYRGSGRGSNPARAFGVAVGFALVALLVGGPVEETAAALGGTLGAAVVWWRHGRSIRRTGATPVGGASTAAVGAAFLAIGAYPAVADPAPVVVGVVSAVVLAGYVAAPLLGERAARRLSGGPAEGGGPERPSP